MLRDARQRRRFSLRALARQLGKSPAYLVQLERAPIVPGVSEDTLIAIADQLDLDRDQVLAAAAKFPAITIPESSTEIALYRLIKKLPTTRQEQLRRQLETEVAGANLADSPAEPRRRTRH